MKIVCKKTNKSIVDYLKKNCTDISYGTIQKLLRKKDIKIDGKRISKDCEVQEGNTIELFIPNNILNKEIPIFYSDNNILAVNKPANIEVISESEEDLKTKLENQLNKKLFEVHRIDRNTTGLVIFTLNKKTQKELEDRFKHHLMRKYYLAVVVGEPSKQTERLVAYHKKDSQNSTCYISDIPKPEYSKIITNYKLIKTNHILSLLEVEIETGKTHQIRAHLAHIDLPILGDQKYGNKQINKQYKLTKQKLMAYKIEFDKLRDKESNIIVQSITLPTDNFFEI